MSDHQPGQATLLEVATEAGVSLATASRAFNGSTRKVREDLRLRVLAAATKLDYTANTSAQAMARGRTNVVGLVVHDIADPYFSSIAAGVMQAAMAHQLLVTVGSTMGHPERELGYLASLRGQRGRAAILSGSRVDDPELIKALTNEINAFERSGGMVVVIGQHRLPVDTIEIQNRSGAKALGTELIALGYRRFAILAGPRALLTARDRLNGFREAVSKAGLPEPLIVNDEFTRDGGYDAMTSVLDQRHRIEAVFAVNDVMAVGAMAACRDVGLKLPGDMALAGFDDIATLRDVDPGLTTVRLPLGDVGASAIELVVTANGPEPRRRRIKGEVILRASTPRRS
jgi:LacI family transcriptional regulator